MKKLNKFFAILVSLAMMASLCVCMAFAADSAPGSDATVPQGYNDPEAVIGKYLKVNEGTTVPDMTVTFGFVAQASDTGAASAAPTARTDLSLKTNPATPAVATEYAMSATANQNDANAVAGVIPVEDFFTDNNGDLVFTKPGEYIYAVTENATFVQDSDSKTTETMTPDSSTYYVRIYVAYGEDGELEITGITIANENGDKVDPTEDATEDEDVGPDSNGDFQKDGATFVNNYQKTKTIDPDPDDPVIDPDDPTKNVLNITKAIDGATGFIAPDQVFPFEITLTKPANDTVSGANAIGYIMEKDDNGDWALVKDNNDDAVTVTIPYGTATPFELKADQALVFNTLPYGATYMVNEDLDKTAGTPAAEVVENHANYTASYSWIDVTNATTNTGNKGDDLALANAGLIADTDTQNKVDYTNELDEDDVTPTGILINNLPYIVLALVAVGGLCAYVIVRRKNEDNA